LTNDALGRHRGTGADDLVAVAAALNSRPRKTRQLEDTR
jgi:hypothetical protein